MAVASLRQIARMAHQVNRYHCQNIGDESHVAWEDAPTWQQESAVEGVSMIWQSLEQGKALTPADLHTQWMAYKLADGWTLGPVKDPKAKTHPSLVPFADLPPQEQMKDYLFLYVVTAYYDAHAHKHQEATAATS